MLSSLTRTLMPPASKDAAAAGKRAGKTDKRSSTQSKDDPAKDSPTRAKKPPTIRTTTADPDADGPVDGDMAAAGEKNGAEAEPDTFEQDEAEDSAPAPPRASVDLDELPIELIGLTDSFIESLQAKVHATPPNIDSLSQKFQDFYATASSHIATHLAALATRQNRAPPPLPRASTASILRAKAAASISGSHRDRSRSSAAAPNPPASPSAAAPKGESAEQQMVTAEELAVRRKARRALEQKRALMEEAVERRLCEGIYDRIYRHRTTQDEAQDQKLRSKTAALDVVGIGPADLGVDLGASASADTVRAWLAPARAEIQRMGQTHYPLGKLNRLKAAHKAIVDTLAHFHPSASADEIMPMLIYTLITQAPEQLNVVSDLNFIQRFRWETKMEGEAAYCLTNLEAAISFLETVDLSTLRADEEPSGPAKHAAHAAGGGGGDGAAGTPKTEAFPTFPPAYGAQPGLAVPTAATPSAPEVSTGQASGTLVTTTLTVSGGDGGGGAKPAASPTTPTGLRAAVQLRNRRLSDLVNTPAAQAISNASDAVMNTFNAADQGLKTIGNSLEGSYRLFFGRLGQQPQPKGQDVAAAAAAAAASATTGDGAADHAADLLLPKTLDEARKLVTTPPSVMSEDEDASVLGDDPSHAGAAASTTTTTTTTTTTNAGLRPLRRRDTDKMLLLVGGRRAAASRDPSADSTRSGRSSGAPAAAGSAEPDDGAGAGAGAAAAPLLDSVRSLSSSFNPMSRLSGFGGSLRGFGRTASTPAPASSSSPTTTTHPGGGGGDLATAFPELAGALPPKAVAPVAPPVKRFMELHNPGDLRLGEVMELLRDYRRLATALKDMGAFSK